MTVQIKVLKGFKNYYNHEQNTLSLLVKSNYELIEHLSNSKEKLLIALTKIIDYYNLEIYFYHKLQVPKSRDCYYLKTKWYKLIDPKSDLENRSKDLISMAPSKFTSHFINFIIKREGEVLEISNDDYIKFNNAIISETTKINTKNNNKVTLFIDDDKDVQFEKTSNKESLFVDEDDEVQFEKTSNKESLFVDEDDEDQFEKSFNNIRKRNSQLKKTNKDNK